MGMTMTQKILAAHCGKESVKAGELINARLDLIMGSDVTTPIAIKAMDATMIYLRPTASDNIPINGDMMAMAITVAPTVMPTCVSVAENACIIIGKIA